MHILYLHQYFVPPDGTGPARSYEMSRRLISHGHRVTIITSSSGFPYHYNISKLFHHINLAGIEICIIKINYSNKYPFWRRIIAFLTFAILSTFEALKVHGIDLIFATSTPLSIAIPGIAAKIWHRRPMVFEVRDLWPEVPVAMGVIKNKLFIKLCFFLEKLAYNMSSRVVALSPGMYEGIVKTGFPSSKVKIIPNCSDLDLFRVPYEEGKKFIDKHPYLMGGKLVVYTGTLGHVNGIKYLIDIAAEMLILDQTIQFLIVGDGIERNYLEKHAISVGVMEKNLWMLMRLPKIELPAVLSASNISTSFVIDIPALWNNSANKAFDAFAAGRPLLINHEGWLADFLRTSDAGLVVPPNDSATAAKMLREFVLDEVRYNRARLAAANAGQNDFNRDRLAEELRFLLEDVVANN